MKSTLTDQEFDHSDLPVLWGDGVHDDGSALRALDRGESVRLPNGSVVDRLPKGTFYEIWGSAGRTTDLTPTSSDPSHPDKPALRLVKG
ncbi:MAG: hypothetical protein ABI612_11220 [Betaproteobacteria bacterium]